MKGKKEARDTEGEVDEVLESHSDEFYHCMFNCYGVYYH